MKARHGILQLLFLISILVISTDACHADMVGYTGVQDLRVSSAQLIVTHHHDWGDGNKRHHLKKMSPEQDPFLIGDHDAFIRCTRKDGGQLFQVPSPALSYLWISLDSQYIVGLSDIKLSNPFQMVIYDRAGHLLLKQHITPMEASFTHAEFTEFIRRFPATAKQIKAWSVQVNERIYVDFMRMGAPRQLGDKAWHALWGHVGKSHFSPNFGESVTNCVYWYNEKHPAPQLRSSAGHLVAISLLDPKGKRFTIPVADTEYQ